MTRVTGIVVATVYGVAALAAAGVLVFNPFQRIRRSAIVDGPMVQNVATGGFSVVWWSRAGGDQYVCLRGGGEADLRVAAVARGERYEARAEGLNPGARYRYDIVTAGEGRRPRRLCGGTAQTARPPSEDLDVLVFADSGSGSDHQRRLATVMRRYPADLILHAGDLVYPRGAPRDYHRKFFRVYGDLLDHVPFYPVLGNHDVRTDNGAPLLTTFTLPSNGPPSVQAGRCYSFDAANVRFVGIDSNLDTQTLAAVVAPWLREVLGASDATWKIVFFHHAPWAGGSRGPDVRISRALVPAIEQGGADLVFCAHNHLYERTRPMRAGTVSPAHGVVYLTTAAGGKSLHKERQATASYLAAFNDSVCSFTWAHVVGNRLELMQISEDDDVLDTCVLTKGSGDRADCAGVARPRVAEVRRSGVGERRTPAVGRALRMEERLGTE